MRIYVLFLSSFLGLVSVLASPPEKEDTRKKVEFLAKLDLVPTKKLRLNEDYKDLNHDNHDPLISCDFIEYNQMTRQVDLVIEKFDFYVDIIKIDDRREYRKRESIFLKQIDENMYVMKKKNRRISSLPIFYYKENVRESKIKEYRTKMIKALVYIKINMNGVALEFFKGMNEVMDEIRVYRMIDEQERNYITSEIQIKEEEVQKVNTNEKNKRQNLKRKGKNIKELEQEKVKLEEENKELQVKKIRLEDTIKKIKELTIEKIAKLNINSTNSSGSSNNISNNYNSNGSNSGTSNNNINNSNNNNNTNNSNKEEEETFISNIQYIQDYYQEIINGREIKTKNMKTFETHIKEGYIPEGWKCKSKLAQAMTAAIIIIQESGMMEDIKEECKIKIGKTNFIINKLFEDNEKKIKLKKEVNENKIEKIKKYIKNEIIQEDITDIRLEMDYEIEDIIVNESLKDKEIENDVEEEQNKEEDCLIVDRTEEEEEEYNKNEIKREAINFGINMFPKLKIDVKNNKNINEEKIKELSDLERVLIKREVVVLDTKCVDNKTINFNTTNNVKFFKKVLEIAIKIIENKYLVERDDEEEEELELDEDDERKIGQKEVEDKLKEKELKRRRLKELNKREEEIKIIIKEVEDPIKELMEKKGDMTGIKTVNENMYKKWPIFEGNIEGLKVPVISKRSYLIVDKRYGIKTMEEWNKYISKEETNKKTLLTNYSEIKIFMDAKDYIIIPVILEDEKLSVLEIMNKHKTIGGLFWGIDEEELKKSQYEVIPLPYSVIQGPMFLTD